MEKGEENRRENGRDNSAGMVSAYDSERKERTPRRNCEPLDAGAKELSKIRNVSYESRFAKMCSSILFLSFCARRVFRLYLENISIVYINDIYTNLRENCIF